MIRKPLLLLTLCLFAFNVSDGQAIHGNAGVEDSQQPNTSKGDVGTGIVSVDPYTGTGGANVPIHAFSINGLNLSVSLSYNAKGIRVDEMSSSVGLGWVLNAGGSITRTTYGLEDEITLPSWYTPGSGGNPNYSQQDSVEGCLAAYSSSFSATQYLPTYSIDDKEYDVFHFNVAGRTFDFGMKYDGNGNLVYQTYPESEVKIDIVTKDCSLLDQNGNCGSYTNYRSGIQAKTGIEMGTDVMVFVVTDEAGNKYYFEQGDVEVKPFKLGQGYSADSGYYYPTESWNLSRIVTYAGVEITYEYTRRYMEILQNVTETLYPKPETVDFNIPAITYDPLEIKEQVWKGYKTHISKITYPNATTLLFDVDEPNGMNEYGRCDCKGDFRLNNISVISYFDNNTNNTITYRLNHAYFNTPNYGSTGTEYSAINNCNTLLFPLTNIPSNLDADSAKEKHLQRGIRLKLKSIDRIAMDGTTSEKYYSFEYNSTALPYRFSSKKDYYGYYNGGATQHPYIRTNLQSLLTSNPYNDTLFLSIPYHEDTSFYDYAQVSSPYWGTERTHNFDSMQACVLKKVNNGSGGTVEIIYQDYQLTNPDSAYGYFPYYNIDQYNNPINYTIDPNLQGSTVNDGLVVNKLITSDRYSTENTVTKEYYYSGGERFNQGGYCWFPQQGYKIWTNYFVGQMNYFNGSNHGFTNTVIMSKGYNNQQLNKTKFTFSNLIYYENGEKKSCMLKPTGYYWHTMPGYLSQYRMGLLQKTETYDEYDFETKLSENTYVYHSVPDIGLTNRRYFAGLYFDYPVIGHEVMRPVGNTFTRYVRDSSSSTIYPMVISYSYGYDLYDNNISTTWTDSKGDTYVKYKYYNYNFTGGSNPTITEMSQRGMQHSVASCTWKKVGADSVLLSYGMSAPLLEDSTSYLKFPVTFTMKARQPLTSSEVFFSSPLPIIFGDALDYKNHTFYGSKFSKDKENTHYDAQGNVIETRLNDHEIYMSQIWDSRTRQKIAEAQNARYSDIAFTSFEGDYEALGIDDDDKGNLEFDKNAITTYSAAGLSKAMTGKYVYDISSPQSYITTHPLDDKKYVISFWLNSTVEPAVDMMDNSSVIFTNYCDLLNTVGDWKLYSATIHIDSGKYFQIRPQTAGQTCYIDEIRLYPVLSSMTTYTYKPLMGVGTVDGPGNYILYNEYDIWGDLLISRDLRGNIISQFEHVINSATSTGQSSGGGSSAPGGGS